MAKSDVIKVLAEKTGKSIDEIKHFLVKLSGGARDIDMGDIKSPPMKRGRPSKTPVQSPTINPNEIDVGNIDPITIKKGRPAKSPLIDPNEIDLGRSKGKLEVGDTPSSPVSVNELDMGDISPINPNIDDYRLPYKSTGIDAVGGNKVPSVVNNMTDMIDDMAGPLTSRKTTIPTEVGPQVLGKGTSRVARKADDIVDAEMIDKVNKMPEGPLKTAALKKLGLLGLGTAAVAGGLSLLSDDDKSPSADFSPVAINGMSSEKSLTSNEKSTLTGKKESPTQKEQGVPVESLGEELKSEQTREPSSDRLSYMDMMQNAQQAASQNRLQAALLKAGMQAGAAIAGPGVKADTSMADALAEAAGIPVSDVKGLMETEAGAKKLKELERQEKEEADLKDPNSEISKFTSSQLAKYGVKVNSAWQAKQLNPQIFNLLAQEKAHKQAMDLAKITAANKLKQDESKLNERDRKFIQGLRKEATTGSLGKQYSTYSTGQRTLSALNEFTKNPSGYTDYATLMGGLKSLQGDESVVKEAEIRLGMSATSAIDTVYNYLQKAATGKMLNADQRKEMTNTIKILTDASKQQYLHAVKPILEQAEIEGIDPSLILSGSLSDVKSSNSKQPISVYSEKEELGIANYMKAKGIDREEAVRQLKDGKRLK